MIKIAIVTRNRPKILRDTLENLKQHELIEKTIIIDGSDKNRTREVCENFEVDYYEQESAGMTAARNEAVKYVNSEYVVFIDDDVRVSDTWYKTIQENLKRKDIVGVTGKLSQEKLSFSGVSKKIRDLMFGSEQRFGEILDNGVINGDFFYNERKKVDHMPGCNMAYEVEVLRSCGGFEEKYDVGSSYREDTVASYKVGKKGKIIYDPKASLNHIKADEERYEKKRIFYNTYLTRYFLDSESIISGLRGCLEHILITAIRHVYFGMKSLKNRDKKYWYYLKGDILGVWDFLIKDREPIDHI